MSDTETHDARPPDLTRRTLTPFGYAVTIAVPLLIAAVAFTFLHFHYDKEDLVSGELVPVLTAGSAAGASGQEQLTGQLVLGPDRCIHLQADGGERVDLVWPADYEASVQRVNETDQLKVYDVDRNIVARSGQTIRFDGTTTELGPYADRPCAPASGTVFEVGEVQVLSNNVGGSSASPTSGS